MKSMCALALMAAAGLAGSASAAEINLGFTRVEPHNAAVNPASQFNAKVSDVSGQPNQVVFKFTNTATIYSSIMEIYFDSRGASPLSSLFTPLSQNGASFTGGGANPGNLPGGVNVGFNATGVFSADAGNGGPTQGIDTSADWVEMKFALNAGKTFADVASAIASGDLRLGLHVIAITSPTGGQSTSDSFVSAAAVPLPPAVWAGAAMMGGVLGIRRMRRARAN